MKLNPLTVSYSLNAGAKPYGTLSIGPERHKGVFPLTDEVFCRTFSGLGIITHEEGNRGSYV